MPAVYTSTLFLLLLDRTRALSAASSGHRKVDSYISVAFQFSLNFHQIILNLSGKWGNNADQVSSHFPLDFPHHTLCSHYHWTGELINNFLEILMSVSKKKLEKNCNQNREREKCYYRFSFPDEHQYLSG